jgi:hypothetical protein
LPEAGTFQPFQEPRIVVLWSGRSAPFFDVRDSAPAGGSQPHRLVRHSIITRVKHKVAYINSLLISKNVGAKIQCQGARVRVRGEEKRFTTERTETTEKRRCDGAIRDYDFLACWPTVFLCVRSL